MTVMCVGTISMSYFSKIMICKLNFLFAGEYYADPYFCRLGNNWTLSVYCNFYTSIYRQYIKMLHPVFNHCSIQSSGHKSLWDKIKLYFMSDVHHKHVLRQTGTKDVYKRKTQ